MDTRLIMLTGHIGSGKTLAAGILAKYGFKEEMFASPIKEFAKSIGFSQSEVYGTQIQKQHVNKFYGVSGREFLQRFGSEVCRDALPDAIPNMKLNDRTLWARVMEKKIRNHELICVSDGRFTDEAALIKEYGGIIIRLNRSCDVVEDDSDESIHQSETQLDDIVADYTIDNNGTVEELEIHLYSILIQEEIEYEEPKEEIKISTRPVIVVDAYDALAVVAGLFTGMIGMYFSVSGF